MHEIGDVVISKSGQIKEIPELDHVVGSIFDLFDSSCSGMPTNSNDT